MSYNGQGTPGQVTPGPVMSGVADSPLNKRSGLPHNHQPPEFFPAASMLTSPSLASTYPSAVLQAAVLETITAESFFLKKVVSGQTKTNPGFPRPRSSHHARETQRFRASSFVTMFFCSTKQTVQLEQGLLLPSLPTFN